MTMRYLRQKLAPDITLTETLVNEELNLRKYTATICGFERWHIVTREASQPMKDIVAKCFEIRDRILEGDEEVFHLKMPLLEQVLLTTPHDEKEVG